jgi:hypothetical protein
MQVIKRSFIASRTGYDKSQENIRLTQNVITKLRQRMSLANWRIDTETTMIVFFLALLSVRMLYCEDRLI